MNLPPSVRILSLCLLVSLLAACDQLSPTILSFTANPTSVEAGDEVTLSWVAIGPEDLELTLTPGDVNLSAIGSYTVTPTQTTTYTLTTNAEGGAATRNLTVAVANEGLPVDPELCDVALIPDKRLRFDIRAELNSPDGVSLCQDDLLALTQLRLRSPSSSISDLTGLSYAINLVNLDLNAASITDISELASLTKLQSLNLGLTSVTDVSPLAGLTELTDLQLATSKVIDISPLAGLTQLDVLTFGSGPEAVFDISVLANFTELTYLSMEYVGATDISALAGLTKLRSLFMQENKIIDISPLTNLTELEGLFLNRNEISDISALAGLEELIYLDLTGNSVTSLTALVENSGLSGSGNTVDLRDNPLDLSPNSHPSRDIATLRGRGVNVVTPF